MSQALEHIGSYSPSQDSREFSYTPISPLAPVSALMGVLSAIGLFWDFALIFSVAGLIIGFLCLRQIRQSSGAVGGKAFAWTGVITSLLFLGSGTSLLAFNYVGECPPGYERVSFSQVISEAEPTIVDNQLRFTPAVEALDGEKVFVKGYMYPTGQMNGISGFVLVKDNQQCCFGGQPAMKDMIYVRMEDGKVVDYTDQLVAVAGTFQTFKPDFNFGTNYKLEGQHFSVAATSY